MAPPDHNFITFSRCPRRVDQVCHTKDSYLYSPNNSPSVIGPIKPILLPSTPLKPSSSNSTIRCFNGSSTGFPPVIPPLFSLTCCQTKSLSGSLPTVNDFVSSSCCLPGGQTCLIDATCCSGKCLGLQSGSTSGNCSGLSLAYNDPSRAPIVVYGNNQSGDQGATVIKNVHHYHHHHHYYHWNKWNPWNWILG